MCRLTLPIVLSLGQPSIGSTEGPMSSSETPHQPRLYADETVYTLRLPEESVKTLDLGNTARPIMVRKRAGIPAWDGKEEGGMGWGREAAPGWR